MGQSQRLRWHRQHFPYYEGEGDGGEGHGSGEDVLLQPIQPFRRERRRRREELPLQLPLQLIGVLLHPLAGSLLVEDAVDPVVVSRARCGAPYMHLLQGFCKGLRHGCWVCGGGAWPAAFDGCREAIGVGGGLGCSSAVTVRVGGGGTPQFLLPANLSES